MKNINWSKWIAVALSIFIVTQFVDVAFLAARHVRGSGDSDTAAAGNIYEDLLGAVGEDNGLIMSAKASGETSVALSTDSLDMSDGAPGSLTFTIHSDGSTAGNVEIPFPTGLSCASIDQQPVTVEATLTSDSSTVNCDIASYSVSNNILTVSFASIDTSDIASMGDGEITVSDVSFDTGISEDASLPSTWTVDAQTVDLIWPTASDITINVSASDTSALLDSAAIVFTLEKDGESVSAPVITGGTGTLSGLTRGTYVLTQTATETGYSLADPAAFSFSVDHFGGVTSSDSRYSSGTVTFSNDAETENNEETDTNTDTNTNTNANTNTDTTENSQTGGSSTRGLGLLGSGPSIPVYATLTAVDGAAHTPGTVDLVSKGAAGSTSFTFTVHASAADLSTVNGTRVVSFSEHFVVADQTTRTAVSGGLAANMEYTISEGDILLYGTGTTTEELTGTITVTGVTFDNFELPNTADSTTGTGVIAFYSNATMQCQVMLPAKVTPTITLTLANSTGTAISGTTTAAFEVNDVPVTPNASGMITLTDWEPGVYDLTETTAPGSAYSRNTTVFTFTIDEHTGNISVSPLPAASAGVWSGTGTKAASLTIKHADASTTGTGALTITRNVAVPTANGIATETRFTVGASTAVSVTYTLYTKSGSTYTPVNPAVTASTDANAVATFSSVPAGTYYVKESHPQTLNYSDHRYSGWADYAYVSGSAGTNIMDSQQYAEVTITDGTTTNIVMNDNPQYTIKLVNGSGTAVSGKSMKLAGTAAADFYQAKRRTTPAPAITYNSAKTEATWTSGTDGAVFDGELCFDKTYTLTVPKTDSTGTETFVFKLETSGSSVTVNPKTTSTADLTDFAYSDGVITITREIHTGSLDFQLTDATSGSAITTGGAAFKLYTNSGCTTDSGITVTVTNSTGRVTATVPAGTYYLKQDTNKAPTGYENNTGAHTITVSSAGAVTYPPGDPWVTSGTPAKLKYDRINPTLTLTRHDVTTSTSGAPTSLTYGIYTDAACTTPATGSPTVTLTVGASSSTGSISSGLSWNTPYYIKETTATYSGLDAAPHGPYTFSPTMTSGSVDTTTVTATPAEMKLAVVITPSSTKSVAFKYYDADGKTVATGTFAVRDKAAPAASTPMTLTTTNSLGSLTSLLTGRTYTVTQTSDVVSSGAAKIQFEFTVLSTGAVQLGTVTAGTVEADASTTNPTITMKEKAGTITLTMDICTAEGEPGHEYDDRIDESKEIYHVKGFKFSLYSSKSNAEENKSAVCKDVETTKDGVLTFEGVGNGTYYAKCTMTSGPSGATKVRMDKDSNGDYSLFEVTISGGSVTSLKKDDDSEGNWKVKNGHIRAYLQQGDILLNAKSDKTFYLYRLYDGDDNDPGDDRGKAKMSGSTVNFTENKSTYFVTPGTTTNRTNSSGSSSGSSTTSSSTTTSLLDLPGEFLAYLGDMFVLTAHAAEDASKLNYAGQTWQLIDSSAPGTGNSHTFKGLIAGQQYMIREGSEDDSDKKYYLSAVTADKATTLTSSTGSNSTTGTSTANSGTGTSSGTGTGNSGSKGSNAGGARGSATGDAGDLWLHLIIMLIAFDALAADLLYISRKKQVVRRR